MRFVQRLAFSGGIVLLLLLCGCPNFFTSGDAIATLTVSPTAIVSATGQTITMTASGTTVNGATKDVTSSANWSSSNASVATVSGGKVTTVGAGTATITATQDNGSASTAITIIASPLQTTSPITISPSTPTVATTQGSQQFKAQGNMQNGQTVDLTNVAQWSSSNTSVATINNAGLATLVSGAGQTTTITASVSIYSGGTSATASGTTTMTVQ